MIRIFHTGDFHLDSAFCRFSHIERARARERQREVFRKMMKYVKDKQYDILLISGDLFDTAGVSPETEKCVIDELSELSCPVVIAPGNHDPYSKTLIYSDGRLPENVYVFNSEEMQVFSFEELSVQVSGYAFVSDKIDGSPLVGFEPPAFDGVSLLCAHTELDAPSSKYAPISASDIDRCGFSYAALGHVHTCFDVFRFGGSVAAYCGFPESRGFDEEGEGGALSVTIEDNGVVALQRIAFGEARYAHDTLDIRGIDDNRALISRLEEYLASFPNKENTAIKLTLTGETEADFKPDMNIVRRALADNFIYSEAEDKTTPKIDIQSLELDYTLRGEVFRALRAELDSTDAEKSETAAEALRLALLAIDGRELI